MPFIPPQARIPGEPIPEFAQDCRNTAPFKGKPTRLACQIDFRVAGVKHDVAYPVTRLVEGLLLLARDYPAATDIEAKMKEVPLTDFEP